MDKFSMIQSYYERLAHMIASDLQIETSNHPLTSGISRELIWLEVFEKIVPTKFKIAQSVFLIDSYGKVSKEVDLAIYDEQYTPYIFNRRNILFIPIEAVVAVVQSKSNTMDQDVKKNLKRWAKSIYKLKPSLNAVTRTQQGILDTSIARNLQTQTATRPILILCTLNALKTEVYEKELALLPAVKSRFDFILHLDKEKQLQCIVDRERTLDSWYKELNHYKLERYRADFKRLSKLAKCSGETTRKLKGLVIRDDRGKENVLLTFKMQFNQLLMLMNNPMFFPHASYVNLFNCELNKA